MGKAHSPKTNRKNKMAANAPKGVRKSQRTFAGAGCLAVFGGSGMGREAFAAGLTGGLADALADALAGDLDEGMKNPL